MGFVLILGGLFILGLVIGLTLLFSGLLQRGSDGRPGLTPWLAVPLGGLGALIVVGGGGWALLVALCSGTSFH